MISLEGKRIWVAGHRGMVGSALVRRLSAVPGVTMLVADRRELDLTDRAATTTWALSHRPDMVFMAAARVGGILANSTYPVAFLQENLAIELSTISASFESGVEKFMLLGSSCIYPKFAPQPISEDSLLTAPLEPTNQWYAIAKIAGVMLCDAYRQQYDRSFISTMPTNLYGPNDNFDLTTSHVLPATIRKIVDARDAAQRRVTIWGSGSPLREFMHVDDLADALVFLMEHYDEAGPINVGTEQEISILELHQTVAELAGWRGSFEFDRSKPDGTPRKLMDSGRLAALGWRPRISLRDGITQMIELYSVSKAGRTGPSRSIACLR
jgi:GDP-L-fucose synthase